MGHVTQAFLCTVVPQCTHMCMCNCSYVFFGQNNKQKKAGHSYVVIVFIQVMGSNVLTNNSYVMDSEESPAYITTPPVQVSSTSSLSKIYSLVVDEIFLRINSRAYKNPGEKWQLSNACLKIMCKILIINRCICIQY